MNPPKCITSTTNNGRKTTKLNVFDQRKEDNIAELIQKYFKKHTAELRKEVKSLRTEMNEMQTRMEGYEKELSRYRLTAAKSPERIRKSPNDRSRLGR